MKDVLSLWRLVMGGIAFTSSLLGQIQATLKGLSDADVKVGGSTTVLF